MRKYNSYILVLHITVSIWLEFKVVHKVAPPIAFVAWWLKPFLPHLWCAYAMVLCLSWIVRRAVGGVCVEHNYPKMWMD